MDDRRLSVLGATGKVGSRVVRGALDDGWRVSVLVRDRAGLAPDLVGDPRLRIVVGGLDDADRMREALFDAAAVVIAAGVRYRWDLPWAGVRGRADVVPAAVQSVRATGFRGRVVLLSAFGVGDSWAQLPGAARAVISSSALRTGFAQLGRGEDLVRASGRPASLVRAVTLTDRPGTGEDADATGRALRGNPRVSRDDVATLLLREAAHPDPGVRVRVAG